MKLYKFISKNYVDDFVHGQSIRIGTLDDFRKQEKHQIGIGDALEASSIAHGHDIFIDDHRDPKNAELIANLERSRAVQIRGPNQVTLRIGTLSLTNVVPNLWIFSCSWLSGEKEVGTLLSKFGYECAVEILSVDNFSDHIVNRSKIIGDGNSFGSMLLKGFHNKVEYRNIEYDVKTDFLQASPFVKEKSFEEQREYRLVFQPKSENEPIEPIFLECPKIKNTLRRII
jgi:hypothetical protein